MARMTENLRRAAAAALAVVGAIHIILSPEYFGEQAYIGVLFVLGGVALLAFSYRLWRADDVPSWLLGALTMAGMGIGFVLSRTTGLPGFHESEWEPSGVLSVLLELGFIGALALHARVRPARRLARAA